MVNKIFHIADIHIPNNNDKRPYKDMLKVFLDTLEKRVSEYGKDSVRIVIVGDTFHSKVRISNEAMASFHYMLNRLNNIATTYIIAGNHDMLENNLDRMDSITPTFEITNVYPHVYYLDKECQYKSACIPDDNVIFALYSMHDKFAIPDIETARALRPNSKVIGLYHGDTAGSVTDLGRKSESGISHDDFKGCDCVMAGHIHKYQEINVNGMPIVYAGSLFQQDLGENVSGHGFVEWDIPTMQYRHIPVDNDYRYFKISVRDYEDIREDKEKQKNK